MGSVVEDFTEGFGTIAEDILEHSIAANATVAGKVLDSLGVIDINEAPAPGSGEEPTEGATTTQAPSAFRRPRPVPVTAEQARLDRRRSIASAIRRRKRGAPSILGGAAPSADPLGGP